MVEKINKWKCPNCGKEILSLYAAQFIQNVSAHKASCIKKEVKGE